MIIIVSDAKGYTTKTKSVLRTQRIRKAYAKHRGTMEQWLSYGFNHCEEEDDVYGLYVLRDVPASVETLEFENLVDFMNFISGETVVIGFNKEFALYELMRIDDDSTAGNVVGFYHNWSC